jgi:hypothetical protein
MLTGSSKSFQDVLACLSYPTVGPRDITSLNLQTVLMTELCHSSEPRGSIQLYVQIGYVQVDCGTSDKIWLRNGLNDRTMSQK